MLFFVKVYKPQNAIIIFIFYETFVPVNGENQWRQ